MSLRQFSTATTTRTGWPQSGRFGMDHDERVAFESVIADDGPISDTASL